jgi:hypothetical protein
MASGSSDSNINLPNSDGNKKISLDENDVKVVLSIINVISRRGGFLPSEFSIIGGLFEKFTKLTDPPEK